LSGFAAGNARRARSGSSSSPLALAELRVAANTVSVEESVEDMIGLNIFSTNVVGIAADRKAAFARLPDRLKGANRGARAGGRHADATGTFHRQHALLKAAAAELASRLWDLPAGATVFALFPRLFAG